MTRCTCNWLLNKQADRKQKTWPKFGTLCRHCKLCKCTRLSDWTRLQEILVLLLLLHSFCLLLLFLCLMAQHACSMGRAHNFRTPQEQALRSLAAAASHQSWFEHKWNFCGACHEYGSNWQAGGVPGRLAARLAPKCSVQAALLQLWLPATDKRLAWLQYPRPSLYKINSPEVHTKEIAKGRKIEKGNRKRDSGGEGRNQSKRV